jgi:ABC-type Fe3+/spermidine/putrescine transport system ATPase subunit
MAAVVVDQLLRRFGRVTAVDRVDLAIAENRLTALLGPSGCGKTTLLRLIAGLEQADAGRVTIAGRDVTALAPEHRNIGMMFQSYALFPHMTVGENLRFPLRMRGLGDRADQGRRIARALDLVRLPDVADRLPRQLSGGQQQRVAFARALIAEPDVLLLDEPLSNLDARLRDEMQMELVELRRRVPITTIIVTHDQNEALALADEVAVMRAGRIEQVGAPDAVWRAPASPFVADFLGGANLLPVQVADGRATLAGRPVPLPMAAPDGPAILMIRPEQIVGGGTAEVALDARIEATAFHGTRRRFALSLDDGTRLKAELPADHPVAADGRMVVGWPVAAARLFPPSARE